MTAVERSYQTRRIITFLRAYLQDLNQISQIMNKNDVKTKCKYKR